MAVKYNYRPSAKGAAFAAALVGQPHWAEVTGATVSIHRKADCFSSPSLRIDWDLRGGLTSRVSEWLAFDSLSPKGVQIAQARWKQITGRIAPTSTTTAFNRRHQVTGIAAVQIKPEGGGWWRVIGYRRGTK